MANKSRARVVSYGKKKGVRALLKEFKRAVGEAGILHEYKEHQFFKSKSEKRREKQREVEKKMKLVQMEKDLMAGKHVKAPKSLIRKVLRKKRRRF